MKDFKYELSLKWRTCFANLSCSIRTLQDLGLCIDFIYLSQQMCKKENWCVSSCKHWIFEAYLDSASKGNEGNLEELHLTVTTSSDSYASLMLSNRAHASITQRMYGEHKPTIVKWSWKSPPFSILDRV